MSSLTISSGRYTGGFSIGGNVEIEGCVFNGKINGSEMSGGFVGYSNSKLKITNSLFAPKDGSSISGGTFYYNGGGNITPENSYYTEALGTPQGLGYNFTTAPANIGTAGEAYSVSGITPYTRGLLYGGSYYMTPEAMSLADNATNDVAAINSYFADVTLQGRTLYKDGDWNTLCLPFDVEIAGSALDGTGVVARTLTEASITGTTLNLTFGDAVTTLTAGVPYIIKWTKDDEHPTIDDPLFSGVTIDATDRSFDNGVSGDGRVRFIGTYNSTTFTDEDRSILFLGAENKLYYPQPDIDTENPANSKYPTIGAQRAYFKIGDGSVLARRLTAFNIDFGDEETQGIMTTDYTDYTDKASAWYDLQGRRVSESGIRNSELRHGLYIHNGRKVVVP